MQLILVSYCLFYVLYVMCVEKCCTRYFLNWWYVGRKNKSPRTGKRIWWGRTYIPTYRAYRLYIALRNVLRSKAGLMNLIKARGPITNILEPERRRLFVSPIILTHFYLKHIINTNKFHLSCALRSDKTSKAPITNACPLTSM